jgi:hypothetical protein
MWQVHICICLYEFMCIYAYLCIFHVCIVCKKCIHIYDENKAKESEIRDLYVAGIYMYTYLHFMFYCMHISCIYILYIVNGFIYIYIHKKHINLFLCLLSGATFTDEEKEIKTM